MPGASRRVRRLEKEAILRVKDTEYTREQSDGFLSKLNLNYDDDEDTERHRRHVITRPIRQIQREVDYPVETLDKITERIQQEVKRRQMAQASAAASSAAATTTTTSTTRNYHTPLSSSAATTTTPTTRTYRTSLSSTDNRANLDSGLKRKYTSSKHTSGDKLY